MLRPHPKYRHFNIGREGSVIYYAWHDIPCVRSYTKPRNPRTACQQANRNIHGSLTRLSGETKAFRRFCYEGMASYHNSHTAFIGIQMCQLHRVTQPVERPLQAQVHWASGPLPGASQMTFSWKNQPSLSWECDKRRLTRQSDPDNRVLWILWNASKGLWQWSLNGGKRRDGKTALSLPQDWKGDEFYIWLLFYDPKKKRFSCDSFLHVKEGQESASCHIISPSLFTCQGFTLDVLVTLWTNYRSLGGWERQKFREKWFSQ